jgi:ribulose-bisphosphate carboxylase large chain
MKYADYVQLNYRPSKNDLVCEFYLEPNRCGMKEAAGAVASESSVGTWTEITTAPPRINDLAAKVFSIKGSCIKIAYPSELFEPGNMPQILSSVAGNIFGMKSVKNLKLTDIHFPGQIVKSFYGPLYGIEGIRNLLKVKNRPLVGTIVKPKLGLNEKEHAQVAYNAWIGGCDIVKDDENLSSMSFNKFEDRILETLKMRDLAEEKTGEKKIYMPNITAETQEMVRRARFVKQQGGEYIMVDIISCGWSSLQTLREENQKLKLVIHAHRAGYAALSRNPKHGISMLVIAKIARLIGVDQLHIGTIIGKMETPEAEVLAINKAITEKQFGINSVFAVCSGGLQPGHAPYIMKALGKDIILQFGGGIHGHPLGTRAGAKAARDAVEATMQGISLKEASKKSIELKKALELWG